MAEREPVQVSARVKEGIDFVRETGATNMYDRRAVQYYADQMGYYETVMFLEDYPREYGRGISAGFEVEEQKVYSVYRVKRDGTSYARRCTGTSKDRELMERDAKELTERTGKPHIVKEVEESG